MKKYRIPIMLTLLFITLSTVWSLSRPKVLGNINQHFTKPTTDTSSFSFLGETNDRIKISFKSDIKSNNIIITIYNSSENAVYELDNAKELETYFTLEKTDTYTVEAKCNGFMGKYKLVVYQTN